VAIEAVSVCTTGGELAVKNVGVEAYVSTNDSAASARNAKVVPCLGAAARVRACELRAARAVFSAPQHLTSACAQMSDAGSRCAHLPETLLTQVDTTFLTKTFFIHLNTTKFYFFAYLRRDCSMREQVRISASIYASSSTVWNVGAPRFVSIGV
jgi:hypothetical protein